MSDSGTDFQIRITSDFLRVIADTAGNVKSARVNLFFSQNKFK
jgi:hypothetical protein